MGRNPKDWSKNVKEQKAGQGKTLLGNGKVVETPAGGWPEDVRGEAGSATAVGEFALKDGATVEVLVAEGDAKPSEEALATEQVADLQVALQDAERRAGRFELSEHDTGLITRAITDRADRLEKVAKMTAQEGYPKQAAVLRGDAEYSREQILPMFEPQLKVFEETETEAIAGAANVLHQILSTAEFLKRPAGEVAEEIAQRVIAFGREVHVRSYSAGVADRTKYSEAGLMIAALAGLKKKPGDAAEEPAAT